MLPESLRYSISVHIDFWNFLCKCLPHMQKSCYNTHTRLLHQAEQNTTCQSKLREQQATMLNKEATQWPPYVENKRGIPMCITPYEE